MPAIMIPNKGLWPLLAGFYASIPGVPQQVFGYL